MITASDLIHLPYTPDLTEGGIAYACRSLAYTYDRMGGAPPDRLRRIAAGVAVELAFRRHLAAQEVPFDVLGATPFTAPDRYDVSLGGHRCDIKSFLITHRDQIRQIRAQPELVLDAPALVPLDQFTSEGHHSQDIYTFAFLLGLTTASQGDLRRAIDAGKPAFLIHALAETWARPKLWLPLEDLALKSECASSIRVEIGGMDGGRAFVTSRIELPPKTRIAIGETFHSLAYIHPERLPDARIGIHCPRLGEATILHTHEWGNIWVYGMDILLAGWLTHEAFRCKAHVLPVGSRTFQYARTRTKNLAVPMANLQPLGGLFERVRAWGKERESGEYDHRAGQGNLG
ncbi:MAG: hypothetical protein ABIJ39_13950 [Chloroflexota bacterium]